MKNLTLIVICSVIAFVLLISSFMIIYKPLKAKDQGIVTIEFIDIDNNIVVRKDIPYFKDDSLHKIIKDNFDGVMFNDNMLYSIEGYVTPDDLSNFICVYLNDVPTQVRINGIRLHDKDKITLRVEDSNNFS